MTGDVAEPVLSTVEAAPMAATAIAVATSSPRIMVHAPWLFQPLDWSVQQENRSAGMPIHAAQSTSPHTRMHKSDRRDRAECRPAPMVLGCHIVTP
jgi:hypothetical protein